MANLTAYAALDMTGGAVDFYGTVTVATATHIQATSSTGAEVADFYGAFTYLPGGDADGPISELIFTSNGTQIFDATDVGISFGDFTQAVRAGGGYMGGLAAVFAGDDVETGSDGNDALYAFDGNDLVHGNGGNDRLFGGLGFDTIYGGAGNDRINSGAGNDRVVSGAGRDLVHLGSGNDLFHDDGQTGVHGQDTVWGGSGADTLRGGGGNDVFHGGGGADRILGGIGNDRLSGNAGQDTILGSSGNDTLLGGAGNDRLTGAAGADHMVGGAGNDMLTGGAGPDSFVFTANGGQDTITDFGTSNDLLRISVALAGTATTAADIVAHDVTDTGAGLVLAFDDGTSIELAGVHDATGLDAHIFLFG